MAFAVWKVGGSLFDLPDLADRLFRLHANYDPRLPTVIIPGGGLFADAVRQIDQVHRLDPRHSHHLALDAMRLSASLVAGLFQLQPENDVCQQLADIEAFQRGSEFPSIQVWDVIDSWNTLLPQVETICGSIPSDWRLTSDAIAGGLAALWGAERFVLVKSIDRPALRDWHACAEEGAVDEVFPGIAPHLPNIKWVNLMAQ